MLAPDCATAERYCELRSPCSASIEEGRNSRCPREDRAQTETCAVDHDLLDVAGSDGLIEIERESIACVRPSVAPSTPPSPNVV